MNTATQNTPTINLSDVETFLANLKRAIFDRESVMVGSGEFHTQELMAVRDVLTGYLATGASPKSGDDVLTFAANLRHDIRNREVVSIGGGTFSGSELESVVRALAV